MLESALYAFAYGGLLESLPAGLRKYPRGFLKMTAARLAKLAGRLPDEPLAHAWLARARLNKGQTAKAGPALDRALELDGECLQALCWRGELFCKTRDFSAALSDLDRALRIRPGFIPALLWRARACRGLGDETGVERSLESARRAARLGSKTDAPSADLISPWIKNALPGRPARAARSPARPSRADLSVDPRIELLAALDLRTKGNPCPSGETGGYHRRILEALDRDHPACRLYAAMKPNDWANRRPAALLLSGLPPPSPAGGAKADNPALSELLSALRSLAAAGFMDFFAREKAFYAALLEPVRNSFERMDHAGPLERYLGLPLKHRFHCVASPLYHGCAVEDVRLRAADGASDCWLINGHSSIGDDGEPRLDPDGPELWHAAWEQGAHCAVEPVVRAAAGTVVPKSYDDPAQARLSRAIACRLTALEFGRAAGLAVLSRARGREGPIAAVCGLLEEYERSRRKYPTIAEFYPKLVGPLLQAV